MVTVPRKDALQFKAGLLTHIADQPNITGAQLIRLYPPTERTTVYRYLRQLRQENLISVENLSTREYAHLITPVGKQWLLETAKRYHTLSDKLLGALGQGDEAEM